MNICRRLSVYILWSYFITAGLEKVRPRELELEIVIRIFPFLEQAINSPLNDTIFRLAEFWSLSYGSLSLNERSENLIYLIFFYWDSGSADKISR